MEKAHRIFLHYFDMHFLQEKVGNEVGAAVRNEARLATRLAILWSDEVIIPAASYFESEVCRSIVDEHKDLLELGAIILVGNAGSLGEFVDKKLTTYPARSHQSKEYRKAQKRCGNVPFITRFSSATNDIREDWINVLHLEKLGIVLKDCGLSVTTELEKNWEQLPERLGMQAFTPLHALQLLEPENKNRVFNHKISNLVNASYFSSFTRDWGAGIVKELIFLGAGYSVPTYGKNLPYRILLRLLRERGMLERVVKSSSVELISLKNDPQWVLIKGEADKQSIQQRGVYRPFTLEDKKRMKVFIVHGHDHGLLYELKDYLQNTLRFEEPIVLMQQPNKGRTIIEKFEDYAEEVDAAVVLLTPDDFGGVSGGNAKSRARQNVIFELGYFVGKLGRRQGRTILMTSGSLEMPSDLQGVIYIDVTNGISSSGEQIRRELSAI